MSKITNKHHKEILNSLEENRSELSNPPPPGYMGNKDPTFNVNNPTLRKIAKRFIREHEDISTDEFIKLLDSLYLGKYDEEKRICGMLLEYYKGREEIDPSNLDRWLDTLIGWAQVDSLCQSAFRSEDLLSNWNSWKKVLVKFLKDKNISKRRASLVLLTNVTRQSDDERLSNLAFENIERLKHEKDILITKAISWLLRDLTKHHRKEVKEYIEENRDTLPKIAIRETTRKLETGRK